MQPEKLVLKDQVVTTRIFGMAFGWENKVINKILWSTTTDQDISYASPRAATFNGTDIVYNLNMNFVERQYILNFYTFGDIMSKVGGLSASIMPILGEFTPFFVLFFLLQVTRVIKDKIQSNYENRLSSFLNKSSSDLTEIMKG